MACEIEDGKLSIPVPEIDYSGFAKDLLDEGHKRLLWQFRNSDNICEILTIIFSEIQILFDAIIDDLDKRQLAKATGEQLNVIGRIVGQDRIVVSASTQFFGWDDTPNALPWAERIGDQVIGGGRWKEIGEPTTGTKELTDGEYRRFIIAKILRNNMQYASACELQNIANIILQSVEQTKVMTIAPAVVQYHFKSPGGLSNDEKVLIGVDTSDNKADHQRIITAGAGIKIEKYTQHTGDRVFAWADSSHPDAAPWAEKSITEVLFGMNDSPSPKGWYREIEGTTGAGIYSDRPNKESALTVALDTSTAGKWAEQIIV